MSLASSLSPVIVGVTLAAIAGAVALAVRLDRSAANAWRQVPIGSVSVGAGYRASDIPRTHAHAPAAVRWAQFSGLVAVGADTVILLLYIGYAAEALDLGGRQWRSYPVSAALNVASALQPLVVLAWMIVVGIALARGASASKTWLARWRVIGGLGAVGNASILYLVSTSGWMVRDILGMSARALGAPYDAPDPDPTGPGMLILVASALGLASSVAAIVGARARVKIP